MLGTLYLIATPIGNLEDLTYRAHRILGEVDLVLCEDTRNTKKLLDHYQIKTATKSFHQHSDARRFNQVLSALESGQNLALVSDAGTPGISDPGAALVAAVRERFASEAKIFSLPGASAVTVALPLSGWPVDRFCFFGFLPHKKGRQSRLKELLEQRYPVLIYESKHRLAKLLEELEILEREFGVQLELMIARELTKMFEQTYFGRPGDLARLLSEDLDMAKGEFVVLLRQAKKSANNND
ncbi:16S rRNA (cytidine(1402)-2'-O)-methyltransferase [Candidatus Falkowbacteria bacterium]|jgi:16S rRNA (cytidine1402-2'-O)-methyltransferase|nr:16S rRNA (cytidine(1402)-2'-O)-methyltransferase [Patescibacteria group bacterium]MDD3435372.1 16S rRNA (cytidine(1402)-2'-O)-methyltransferase [Patescibacteria group bacterium]MDD4466649.1 16S rRNA (cytidine(1402)-2'-O)-methyltransferase [Patescibacteria group bacterium]NCU42994.1 16S rRNA (cytidine(1402)-2'-O)-methyltransferase [Candidatus Falkowbacteria bacterium]